MRPDLLTLDASEAVVAVQAVLTHRLDDYDPETRARAAGLLRLAENRIRYLRRRLEIGADVRPDADAIVSRLLEDGWLEPENVLARAAIVESVRSELERDR